MPSATVPEVLKIMSAKPVLISLPNRTSTSSSLGTAHYSYGFAASKIMAMLRNAGVDVHVIDAPEQFKNPLYGELSGIGGSGQVHLIFRSTEDIRTIPGCYNIACYAWEFESMKGEGLAHESVLLDQVRMLRTCQEVWAPSEFTRAVLLRHGVETVRLIPAPIDMPANEVGQDRKASFAVIAALEAIHLVSRSSGSESDYIALAQRLTRQLGGRPPVERALASKRVFLTICNPYDQRKNLATMIEGFLMATEGMDDAVLLVKLVTSGAFEAPAGYLFHQIRVIFGNPHCIDEDRVVLFSGYLADDEMSALYQSADFYLCASIAEGQNLPLLEAMAHGCIPVSVRNTAMADYINTDNAVVIQERRFSGLKSGLAGDVAGTRLAIDFADRFQIADAIRRAMALDQNDRNVVVSAAKTTVSEIYSPDQVFLRLSQYVDLLVE